MADIVSVTNLGFIIRPSIQIGLLLFTSVFFMYLFVKSRHWYYMTALLVSLATMAFPFINMYRAFFRFSPDGPYSLLLLTSFEHVFICTILMLIPAFAYLRYLDFHFEISNPPKVDLPQYWLFRFNTMDRAVLLLSAVSAALMLIVMIAIPQSLVRQTGGGFEAGALMGIRNVLFLLLTAYSLQHVVLRHIWRKSFSAHISIALSLLLLLALLVYDMMQTSLVAPRTFSVGLSVLIMASSIILLKEYLDRAGRTERMETELAYLESHDLLTGLENRRRFFSDLDQLCRSQASYLEQRRFAILLIDLDFFTNVNESVSNEGGNAILQIVAERLSAISDLPANLYRTGGDEFAILLPDIPSELDAAFIGERVLAAFNFAFDWKHHRLYLSSSIGIAVYPKDGRNLADLTSHADQALGEAKADRNTYRFYAPAMHQHVAGKILMINYLRQAIDRNELNLHFQPQLDLSGRLVGAEALLRWEHPVLGYVSPKDFIPVAEESGLIIQLGTWVIEQSCKTMVEWKKLGLEIPVSINLSPRQLRDAKLQFTLIDNLRKHGLDPRLLHLEITENSLIEDSEMLIGKLKSLSDIGLKLSLDDFGTGYSSLSYLRNLPIAQVKIDRSFVTDLPFDGQSSALVQAIISMVQSLGFKVVAEGVNSLEQLNFLRSHNCDIIQGFYHSEPLDDEGFREYASQLQRVC